MYKKSSQNWKSFFQKKDFYVSSQWSFLLDTIKIREIFECGTFGKRLAGKMGAFAIIPNGSQITQTFN